MEESDLTGVLSHYRRTLRMTDRRRSAANSRLGGSTSIKWRSVGAPPAMPVFVPAFFEERRQGRRRGNRGYPLGRPLGLVAPRMLVRHRIDDVIERDANSQGCVFLGIQRVVGVLPGIAQVHVVAHGHP